MKLSRAPIVLAAAILVVSATVDVHAQGSLLDRGRDFFRELDSPPPRPAELTDVEIAEGLREALRIGAQRVVETLGVQDGFNGRPDVHIPLPKSLAKVQALCQGGNQAEKPVEIGVLDATLGEDPNRRSNQTVPGNAIAAGQQGDREELHRTAAA